MVIFDTSVIVRAFRNNKAALDIMESYADDDLIAITIITKYEILRGVLSKDNVDKISAMLSRFVVLGFTEDALVEAVKVYRRLRSEGKMISELDVLIAGIAAANNEVLVTRDKDFLNLKSSRIEVVE